VIQDSRHGVGNRLLQGARVAAAAGSPETVRGNSAALSRVWLRFPPDDLPVALPASPDSSIANEIRAPATSSRRIVRPAVSAASLDRLAAEAAAPDDGTGASARSS
jgi:hypothetical protein